MTSNDQGSKLSGTITSKANNGIITFQNYTVTKKPGTQARIDIVAAGIGTGYLHSIDTVSVIMDMRLCELGEASIGDNCEVCQAPKYSIDPTETSCLDCPTGAECTGSWHMIPEPGYWRDNIESDLFFTN